MRARRRRSADDRSELETAMGYRFRDAALLDEALTHASMAGIRRRGTRTNERLEFLGDRVLGLSVAHALVERFPTEPEGLLTRRLVALVRTESLAAVATALGLGRWLRTAEGADPGTAMLADCCEAVIGAIYLDGGFAPAQNFVLRHWAVLLADGKAPQRDAKSALKEWADAHGPTVPAYRVVERSGPDHAMTFTVEVRLGDRPPQTAMAATKRAAEQAAAAKLLQVLRETRDG
ncbi:MAG: ribonuclease III [Geminicoccaceae bacterium]